MKTMITTVFFMVLLTGVGGITFIYSGFYDVSASKPHKALSDWVMHTTMQQSVKRRAKYIDAPQLNKEELVMAGINDFEAMCIDCHGAPGQDPGPMGKGLNPQAPDLRQSAQQLSVAELFWVTKHGIRMTGMPAWGATHSDEDLWPVVALMATLPDLSADAYNELRMRAEGLGHHGVDSDGSDNSAVNRTKKGAGSHNDGASMLEKHSGSTHDHKSHVH